MASHSFHSKVAGVTAKNDNGRPRQGYIRMYCRAGMPLSLRREPSNPYDKNAIAVWLKARALIFFTSDVQIGYIKRELAEELAQLIDGGTVVRCEVSEVTGGSRDKPTLGVNILLTQG